MTMLDHDVQPPRYFLLAAACAVALAGCSKPDPRPTSSEPTGTEQPRPEADTLEIGIAALNDFHGELESPAGVVSTDEGEVEAGGAAPIAGWLDEFRSDRQHTATVVAGDLIGASPLTSALFHDEPTIEVMNEIGLDAVAVGNHEFDEGHRELTRIAEGGCHPEDGCHFGSSYDGAEFPFLAANVYKSDGERLFDPYVIREFGDVRVAFVGLVLDDIPSIVMPSAVEGLTFQDETKCLDEIVPKLRDRGIETIVALVHEGAETRDDSVTDIDACPGLRGPIVEIVEEAPDAVDIFASGHTHQTYVCRIDDRLVTSAMSKGKIVTEMQLTVSRSSGDVVEASADNHIVRADGPSSEEIADLVGQFSDRASEKARKPVGRITETLERENDASGESELGRVIADAQLASTRAEERGGADFAFMNPGGVRDSLSRDPSKDEPGTVTYADLHSVQPFRNQILVVTLSGRQIHEILERQWRGRKHSTILHVSSGIRYTWHPDREDGNRVDPPDVLIGTEPMQLDAEYRVAVNNFIAEGGDGFATFTEAKDLFYGPLDIDALQTYIAEETPLSPPEDDRIRRAGEKTSE